CSVISSNSNGGGAQGAGLALLLMVGGVFWRRRTTKRLVEKQVDRTMKTGSVATIFLLACSVLGAGCDNAKIASAPESAQDSTQDLLEAEVMTPRQVALLQQERERVE